PFDLSLYRAIKFSRTKFRDLEAARKELKRTVKAVIASDYEVENPATHARGRLKLAEHATSEQKVIADELTAIQERLNALENNFDRYPGDLRTRDLVIHFDEDKTNFREVVSRIVDKLIQLRVPFTEPHLTMPSSIRVTLSSSVELLPTIGLEL